MSTAQISVEDAVALAVECGAGTLLLFHRRVVTAREGDVLGLLPGRTRSHGPRSQEVVDDEAQIRLRPHTTSP